MSKPRRGRCWCTSSSAYTSPTANASIRGRPVDGLLDQAGEGIYGRDRPFFTAPCLTEMRVAADDVCHLNTWPGCTW